LSAEAEGIWLPSMIAGAISHFHIAAFPRR
jgi:hypothetical protein